jgi:hypothetical protein
MGFWKALSKGTPLGAVALILLPTLGVAGPLFPDVRVSSSANGEYLVVIEEKFDNPDAGVRRVLQTTYLVLRREPFINDGDRLQTPSQFWSSSGWQVTPAESASPGIYLPMISNDGLTLVLVLVGPPVGDPEVMKIYHRVGNTTKLLRAIKLSDLWTADEVKTYVGAASDETPSWYAGATLEFSSDDQELLFRSRWNDTVRIKLTDDPKTPELKLKRWPLSLK